MFKHITKVKDNLEILTSAFPRSPYLIAEIGCNHGGDPTTAIKMIDEAKASGANAVKFQMFNAEMVTSIPQTVELIKQFEFSLSDWQCIRAHCSQEAIDFICTPFDMESLSTLQELDPDAYKIGSGENQWQDLISDTVLKNKFMFIAMGNMTDYERKKLIKYMANVYKSLNGIVFMHCISEYPPKKTNLSPEFIKNLYEVCTSFIDEKCPAFGYSDHDPGYLSAVLAYANGAVAIEKHFMLEGQNCIDKEVSITPSQFKEMKNMLTEMQQILNPAKFETERIDIKRSLYFTRDIPAGQELLETDLIELRPQMPVNKFGYTYIPINDKWNYVGRILVEDVNHLQAARVDHFKKKLG